MILSIEKIDAIEFHKLMMVPFGDTKIHHMALWGILGEKYFTIQTLNSTIHYEHSFKIVLYCDMSHNQNLLNGILIIF